MGRFPSRVLTIAGAVIAALCLLFLVATFVTPWPGVLLIRTVFDKGAADASARLEKHLPPGVLVQQGLRYDVSDPDALLDIYSPAVVDPQAPTVIWVHGGGFVSGRRSDLTNYLKVLAGRGFVTVNVDYTTAPTATYPTPVAQLARALAFVDRESTRLGVNRNAFVLAGDSAGAQIAAQAANIITAPRYAKAVDIAAPIESRQLVGTLLYCGVYDVGRLGEGKGPLLNWFVRTATWAYSGERDWREVPGFERMSVVHHVTAAFPSTFISAGNADPLEPQSRELDMALRKVGVSVRNLFYPSTYEARLGHEYQFDLDQADGSMALDHSIAWLKQLTR